MGIKEVTLKDILNMEHLIQMSILVMSFTPITRFWIG